MMKVILASASPRRRELLTQIVPDFEVIPSEGEEIITKEDPPQIVMELAAQKAESVAQKLSAQKLTARKDETADSDDEMLIIGADTIVVLDGQILGKPVDEADACRMLRALSGNTHQVYTGVCLILMLPGTGEYSLRTFYEKTDVTFYPMTEEEIRDYIETGDPMDKAGAYGIQSGCGKYIRGINGDYNNVVGLPVARLFHEIVK